MHFAPVVQITDPGRELRWLERFILPVSSMVSIAIVPLAEGKVRFQQSEQFCGLSVGLLSNGSNQGTLRGFEQMNSALKAHVELLAKRT